jgi:hypothetical protein
MNVKYTCMFYNKRSLFIIIIIIIQMKKWLQRKSFPIINWNGNDRDTTKKKKKKAFMDSFF